MPSKHESMGGQERVRITQFPQPERPQSEAADDLGRRMVAVLGVHRSGTSALSRSLQALGIDLGDNLMPPAQNINDKGFWEDLDFYEFNERLLNKAGSAWHRLSPMADERFLGPDFAAERFDATALVEKKMSDTEVFAFKDPRTALLLPFWQCIFDDLQIPCYYVISVRNPLEVSESLRKRDGFDPVRSVLLWAKHLSAAVDYSSGQKRVFVDYSALVNSPREQLKRIADCLGLRMPAANSKRFLSFAADFLDPGLRHHRISGNELERSAIVPEPVRQLYRVLQSWCSAAAEENLTLEPEYAIQLGRFLTEIRPLVGYVDQLDEKTAVLSNCVSKVGQRLADTKAEHSAELARIQEVFSEKDQTLSHAQAELEVLRGEHAQAIEQIGEISRSNDELERRRDALLAELEAARREKIQLTEQILLLESRVGDTEVALQAATKNSDGIESELRTLHADSARVRQEFQAEIADAESHLAALHEKLGRYETEIRNLKATLGEKELEIGRLCQAEANLARVNNALLEEKAEYAAQIRDLEKCVAGNGQRAKALNEKTVHLETRLQDEQARHVVECRSLQESLAAARLIAETQALSYERHIQGLKVDLRLTKAENLSLKNSTSWRVTKPIRMLRRVLSK